ncbi:MAG: hotdog fold thioesterase [Magnetococcales bacterium]|nr:hotdog fold thioesterase [Magnetococcales bacterium]
MNSIDLVSNLNQETHSTKEALKIGSWMQKGGFATMLGIQVQAARPGWCLVSMPITEHHLNSVKITHGGASFSLADFAFGLASNAAGATAVGLNAAMSYPAPSKAGDCLIAEAVEESRSKQTGNYRVEVRRQSDNGLVGLFTGTVFVRGDLISQWIDS